MNLEKFLALPSEAEWFGEIQTGWDGPDGSSASTDHIMGIRIGRTSREYLDMPLPANLHDYRYHLGRKHKLGRKLRRAADVAYRDDCIRYIQQKLEGRTMIRIGVVRAWFRYFVLRLFGWTAWRD
jgi:hypothetical protein